MKSFKNKSEFFNSTLHPDVTDHPQNVNAFNLYTQDQFRDYLKKLGAEEIGDLTDRELIVINQIKEDIQKLKNDNSHIDRNRLEFDLAIIFHRNLKLLKWGKWILDDYNMWRWFSMNYFLKEVFWRRGEEKKNKGLVVESAKATYDHLVGSRSRDIFPRRYFIIGERLYDSEKKYDLLLRLSSLSKESRSGGFGNLILNIIDTKLLSPNDNVSKIISELLFTKGKLAEDKEVVRAFVRYNGFKRRLLNVANKEVFEKEICIG